MSDILSEFLAAKPCLIADGAMGTSLFDLGLESGGSPELWNVEHPDRIASVHQGYVAAGADIILTNTFGGSRYRLKLHQAQDRVAELNRAAAGIARGVADAAGREVLVAGDLGPTGELFQPLGPLTMDSGAEAFAEQARALAEGGVDFLWIETMSSREEVAAAVQGARETVLAMVCTMTFDTAGRTMMGITPEEAAVFCHELNPAPVAYGANCGNGPAELVAVLGGIARTAAPDAVLVAKGNCGVPSYQDGHIHYDGTPEAMAIYARLARDAGARIIGACCGSTPEHLAAVVAALEGYEPGDAPSIEAIQEALGPIPFAAKLQAVGSLGPRRSGRRRSRRRGVGSAAG